MGRATQDVSIYDEDNDNSLVIETDGSLNVNATVTSTSVDGAILDGVNSALKAEVDTDKRLHTQAMTTDRLYEAGFVDSFSDSITIYFGSPQGLNFKEIHLKTLGENNCPSVVSYVTALTSTTDTLQIFRASSDTFMGAGLFAALAADSTETIDDFEGSNTSNWIESNNRLTVSDNTSVEYEGAKCMQVKTKSGAAGQNVSRVFGTDVDMSTATEVSIYVRSNDLDVTWSLSIGDGTNWIESSNFGNTTTNTWEKITISITSFSEGGTGTTDMSAINIIDIKCESDDGRNRNTWFDLFTYDAVGDPVDVELELYDFGSTANPTNISQGTRLNDDDGNTSITISVAGTAPQRYASAEFPRGVDIASNKLTVGDYYGLRIKATSTVYLFGSSTQTYNSGKTYTETTSTGAFVDVGKSIGFQMFYSPSAYLTALGAFSDAPPERSEFNMGIKYIGEDNANGQIMCGLKFHGETAVVVPFARPEAFPLGSRLIFITDKDEASDMTQITMFVQAITTTLVRYN